tara:strand:+ start:854 stop:1471 length:618 start_codon:yes stop_codon:yes gene_type:complete
VKHTNGTNDSAYNWRYSGTNSKGEPKFKHDVDETLDDVLEYLDSLEGVEYSLREGATMLWIDYKGSSYSYYYTTGRWSPKIKGKGRLPDKHYRSKNIRDLMGRFILPIKEREYKVLDETIESVEKLLSKANIEYKIEKDVVTLTSKSIPRLDGKGNKRQYVYQYTIGKGRWRSAYIDGTYRDTVYKAKNIQSFLTEYFVDEVGLK